MQKNKKVLIIAAVVLILIAAALFFIEGSKKPVPIEGAKTILWNGPAGVFEFDKFAEGSRAIAEAIAKATAEGAFSLIGGGDSVACINKFGMADQVSYISTGGGALLEAIEGKELPGVAAICKK